MRRGEGEEGLGGVIVLILRADGKCHKSAVYNARAFCGEGKDEAPPPDKLPGHVEPQQVCHDVEDQTSSVEQQETSCCGICQEVMTFILKDLVRAVFHRLTIRGALALSHFLCPFFDLVGLLQGAAHQQTVLKVRASDLQGGLLYI